MSKYAYIRKHKLNGKRVDITNEIIGMMQINDYLLATVPKMTKLIDEIHTTLNDESLTEGGIIYKMRSLFSEFEKE